MKAIPAGTASGQIVYIEVSEDIELVIPSTGDGEVAGTEDVASDMMQKFEEVGTTIAEVCQAIHRQILATIGKAKPEELTLQFGVKLAGEAGIPLVTKGSVEGTFEVTAVWKFAKEQGK